MEVNYNPDLFTREVTTPFFCVFSKPQSIQTMKHASLLTGDAPESLYFSVFPRGQHFTASQIPRPIIRLLLTNKRQDGGQSANQRRGSRQLTDISDIMTTVNIGHLPALTLCILYFIEEKRNFRIFCANIARYVCKKSTIGVQKEPSKDLKTLH